MAKLTRDWGHEAQILIGQVSGDGAYQLDLKVKANREVLHKVTERLKTLFSGLESELAEAKRPMTLGPCGLHPKAFWTRTYHCEGTQPFGPDKCVMEGHNHDYCTVCAETAKRESELADLLKQREGYEQDIHEAQVDYVNVKREMAELKSAIQLERAAIVREVAATQCPWCARGIPFREGNFDKDSKVHMDPAGWEVCRATAIPADQPALDRALEERERKARLEGSFDVLRQIRSFRKTHPMDEGFARTFEFIGTLYYQYEAELRAEQGAKS